MYIHNEDGFHLANLSFITGGVSAKSLEGYRENYFSFSTIDLRNMSIYVQGFY